MSSRDIFVSIVCALQNREDYAPDHFTRLSALLGAHFNFYEIILVDRSQTPESAAALAPILSAYKNIQYCALSARVSRGVALTAGLDRAIGDFIVVMDLALDPPEEIPQMIDLARGGADIVYGIPSDRLRGTGLYDRTARVFLNQLAKFNDLRLPPAVSSMRVFSRTVMTYILASADCHRILALAPALSGYGFVVHNYDRAVKTARRVTLTVILESIELIFTTSVRPLRLVSILSLCFSVATVFYAVYVLIIRLFTEGVAPGWAALSLQVAASFFVMSIVFAVMCEYLLQVLEATKRRPVYHISKELQSSVMTSDRGLNVQTFEAPPNARRQASSANTTQIP